MTTPSKTRVALLTPAGRAAVASLSLEGPRAASLVDELFHPARRARGDLPMGRIVFGRWQSPETGEEILVCRHTSDLFEIHCHGGQAAAQAIIDSLLERGCRGIPWPDWVRQSVEDPIRADARIALAAAATERTAMILWDQHEGALGRALFAIETFVLTSELPRALHALDALVRWAPLSRHLVEPWKVVLAGRPNVGKSSLINALVGYERAIVHATPGTTRDVVRAAAAVEGWPIELADTAGLRAGGAALEAEGMRLAREQMQAADLIVLVFDNSRPLEADDEALLGQWPGALRVLNKCDLAAADHGAVEGMLVSALGGEGIDELVRAISNRLVREAPAEGQAMPFLAWHVEVLSAARAALAEGDVETARSLLARFSRST